MKKIEHRVRVLGLHGVVLMSTPEGWALKGKNWVKVFNDVESLETFINNREALKTIINYAA